MTNKKIIDKLKEHDTVSLITMNGTTIIVINYIDVIPNEDDCNLIYLSTYGMCEESVILNLKSVKFMRHYAECIELTIE